MRVLTPDEVKKGPSRALEEQRSRVRDLFDEETRLTISVNNLRDEEARERERVDASKKDMREQFLLLRNEMQSEIDGLKKQREPLLVPIEEIRKEAHERNEKSKQREEAVAKREADVSQREKDADKRDEQHTERLEAIADKEQEIAERDEKSADREKKAEQAEGRAAESLKSVNEKWAIYHEATVRQNRAFEERETKAATAEKANADRAAELDKRDAAQSAEALRLESERTALEQAAKHLGIKL